VLLARLKHLMTQRLMAMAAELASLVVEALQQADMVFQHAAAEVLRQLA